LGDQPVPRLVCERDKTKKVKSWKYINVLTGIRTSDFSSLAVEDSTDTGMGDHSVWLFRSHYGKQSLYRPGQVLRKVEAPRFQDSRKMKVVRW
jgi:hypothetical protein